PRACIRQKQNKEQHMFMTPTSFFSPSRSGRYLASLAAGGLLAVIAGLPQTSQAAEACERSCLSDLLTQYVDALVARDPSVLPLADKVKFTEDSRALELGEGLWQTVTGKGEFRQDYLDTARQTA